MSNKKAYAVAVAAIALVIGLFASQSDRAFAQGLEGPVGDSGDCREDLFYRDMDVVWPGAVCHGERAVVDYHSTGVEGFAEVPTTRQLHCPLRTSHKFNTLGPYCTGRARATVPDNNVMVRVLNLTGEEDGVRCSFVRRIMSRSNGTTYAHSVETHNTTGTGYQTLFFNQLPPATWNEHFVSYSNITCTFAGEDLRSGVVSIWAGAGF